MWGPGVGGRHREQTCGGWRMSGVGRPVKSRCLFWLPGYGLLSRPAVPAGFGMQDTSAPFLAPFASAQEIGRDPREDPFFSWGQGRRWAAEQAGLGGQAGWAVSSSKQVLQKPWSTASSLAPPPLGRPRATSPPSHSQWFSRPPRDICLGKRELKGGWNLKRTKAIEEQGFSSDFCIKDKRPLGQKTENKFARPCLGG